MSEGLTTWPLVLHGDWMTNQIVRLLAKVVRTALVGAERVDMTAEDALARQPATATDVALVGRQEGRQGWWDDAAQTLRVHVGRSCAREQSMCIV